MANTMDVEKLRKMLTPRQLAGAQKLYAVHRFSRAAQGLGIDDPHAREQAFACFLGGLGFALSHIHGQKPTMILEIIAAQSTHGLPKLETLAQLALPTTVPLENERAIRAEALFDEASRDLAAALGEAPDFFE